MSWASPVPHVSCTKMAENLSFLCQLLNTAISSQHNKIQTSVSKQQSQKKDEKSKIWEGKISTYGMVLAKWALSDNIIVKQKAENIEKKLHVEFNMLSFVQQCIKIAEGFKTYSVVHSFITLTKVKHLMQNLSGMIFH